MTDTHTRDWSWEMDQLTTGLLESECTLLPIDDWRIGMVSADRTALHRVRMGAGWLAALLPAPESGAMHIDGRHLLAGDALLVPPACAAEVLTHGTARLYVVAYRLNGVDSAPRLQGARLSARAVGASGVFDDLCGLLAAPNAAQVDARFATARLRAWLRAAVARAEGQEIERHELPRRRLAVERARRFIHEHLTESITLAELCRHAHLQARSLEYGFRDLVGLSPIKYVRMLRLGEVRRRLRTSSGAERSVSEVALDCGFCHLSQFAADYKKVFMESPSATRRAAERPWPGRVRARRERQEPGAAFAAS